MDNLRTNSGNVAFDHDQLAEIELTIRSDAPLEELDQELELVDSPF